MPTIHQPVPEPSRYFHGCVPEQIKLGLQAGQVAASSTYIGVAGESFLFLLPSYTATDTRYNVVVVWPRRRQYPSSVNSHFSTHRNSNVWNCYMYSTQIEYAMEKRNIFQSSRPISFLLSIKKSIHIVVNTILRVGVTNHTYESNNLKYECISTNICNLLGHF